MALKDSLPWVIVAGVAAYAIYRLHPRTIASADSAEAIVQSQPTLSAPVAQTLIQRWRTDPAFASSLYEAARNEVVPDQIVTATPSCYYEVTSSAARDVLLRNFAEGDLMFISDKSAHCLTENEANLIRLASTGITAAEKSTILNGITHHA